MYPENHDIVGNQFYDSEIHKQLGNSGNFKIISFTAYRPKLSTQKKDNKIKTKEAVRSHGSASIIAYILPYPFVSDLNLNI